MLTEEERRYLKNRRVTGQGEGLPGLKERISEAVALQRMREGKALLKQEQDHRIREEGERPFSSLLQQT